MNVFGMIPSSQGNSSACFFVPFSTLRDRYATPGLAPTRAHPPHTATPCHYILHSSCPAPVPTAMSFGGVLWGTVTFYDGVVVPFTLPFLSFSPCISGSAGDQSLA